VLLRLDAARGFAVAASLGDSGVLHARGGALLALTPPQQWRFNCPRQFGYPPAVPDTDYADAAAFEALRRLHPDTVQQYLGLRRAAVVLK
jgi:hypothetical protein